MKTEREMFLYELEGRGFIFKNKTWIHGLGEVGGLFDDDQLNMVWEMWCASASREGYKLVPCEPNQKQIDAGVYAVDLVSNDSIQVVNVYKAMIGAADE